MEKEHVSKPLVIILCLIIFFSVSFSIREYLWLHEINVIAAYKETIAQKIEQNHRTLTDKNIDLISSWMTFDYVNRIFGLPEMYLKTALNISSTRYPYVPISKYVKYRKLDESTFLTQVQDAVTTYFSQHS